MLRKTKSENTPLSERVLVILEYVVNNRMPVRATKVSEDLEIPLASVVRYLQTLINQGYVFRDDSQGEYGATWRVCKLGDMIKSGFTLRSYSSSILIELSNSLKVASCLVVEQDGRLMYLDFVDNPNDGIHSLKRIGKDAPIYCTGSGKVLLSSFSKKKRMSIINQLDLVPIAKKTITDKEALLKELEWVKEHQYAIDDEECEEGYKCISVPLYDYTNQIIAAISVIDKTENLSEKRIEDEILPRTKEVSELISYRLGYQKEA
jgi:DNA-binding IclR family transcriptional regulator